MGWALDGARVLELVDEPAVEYCGRILAGLGADVVKLEPAQGSPSRRVGPFVGDEEGPDRSLSFWHHNVGKRSAVVDDLKRWPGGRGHASIALRPVARRRAWPR